PVLIEALVVVLPTPPFPEVTTIILAKVLFLFLGGFVVSAELSGQVIVFSSKIRPCPVALPPAGRP
ncbi:MAG: hypothetical protein ACX933_13655, partial [Marinobacter adhaerens]